MSDEPETYPATEREELMNERCRLILLGVPATELEMPL